MNLVSVSNSVSTLRSDTSHKSTRWSSTWAASVELSRLQDKKNGAPVARGWPSSVGRAKPNSVLR